MDYNERLKHIAALADKPSAAEFARFTQTDERLMQKYFKGEANPTLNSLEKIASACPWANMNWLITGLGQPKLSDDALHEKLITYKSRNIEEALIDLQEGFRRMKGVENYLKTLV